MSKNEPWLGESDAGSPPPSEYDIPGLAGMDSNYQKSRQRDWLLAPKEGEESYYRDPRYGGVCKVRKENGPHVVGRRWARLDEGKP